MKPDSRQLRLPRATDIDMTTIHELSFKHGIAISFLIKCVELGLDVEHMSEPEMWRAWVRATTTQQPPGGDSCAET